MDGRRGR